MESGVGRHPVEKQDIGPNLIGEAVNRPGDSCPTPSNDELGGGAAAVLASDPDSMAEGKAGERENMVDLALSPMAERSAN